MADAKHVISYKRTRLYVYMLEGEIRDVCLPGDLMSIKEKLTPEDEQNILDRVNKVPGAKKPRKVKANA